jgi:hypothetical protein
MKTRSLALLVPFLYFLIIAGCGRETSAPTKEAPDLPPAESLEFDLSFFQQQNLPGQAQGTDEALAKFNWLNAVVRVAYVNLAVVQNLTPPCLAFAAAVHTVPVLEDDGTWLWTYTWMSPENVPFTIHLRGHVRDPHIEWSLRVTAPDADPPLDDFLWFAGESGIRSNSGYWILNDSDEGQPVPCARIDWDYPALLDRVLTFENIEQANPDFGDRLTYRVEGVMISILFQDTSEGVDSDVTWNAQTGSGSLQVPDYNDGLRACWDEHQEDVLCENP